MKDIEESILDIPRKEGLDSSLWTLDDNGKYTLTEESKRKIFLIIKWMTQNGDTSLNEFGVNLVGSMTSNSYSDSSDIDLHFNSTEIPQDESEEFNKEFRKTFDEQFKEVFDQDDWTIGGHPIEVYFQANPIQDLMSVGCYDVLKDEWKVGPEFKEQDFDPYSEYYNDDMEYIDNVISDIRNVILECFESAVVINNSNDEEFKRFEESHFVQKLEKVAKIFTEAREYRKLKSSPETEQQAKTYRDSRDWKIADSAFKLLDKFGYLGILRTMTQCYESVQKGMISNEQAVSVIISSVKENFSSNKNLNENEKMVFEEMQNEGIKDIVKYAMLMGALASPFSSFAGSKGDTIEKNIPRQELQVLNKTIGDMSYANTMNCVAWTIWTEARGEYQRYGIKSLNAIGSVIWNRADGEPSNFSKVIGQKDQFSWWWSSDKKSGKRNYNGGFTEGTYIPQTPSNKELKNPQNVEIWKNCNQIANKMMEKNFSSTIGNRNMIANKGQDNEEAWNSWGKDADFKIGSHTFGYDSYWDGKNRFGKNKSVKKVVKTPQKIHKIVKGDTIGKIAKKYNVSVDSILKKNPIIKNADNIKIGWKIKV